MQAGFTSTKKQFYDETVFLRDTLADTANRDFYAKRASIALRDMNLGQAAKFTGKGVAGFGSEMPKGVNDALKAYAALLTPEVYVNLAKAAQALAENPKTTLDKLVSGAKGQAQDAVLGVYLDWLQKDSKELGQRAGYVTGQALVDAAAITLGVGVVKNGGKILDKSATLIDGFKTRISDDIALNTLLKNAGAFKPDGTPLVDFKYLTQDQKEVAGVLLGGANGVGQIAADATRLGRAAVGRTGIDDLYKVSRPDVDYIIVEYKFDSTGASPNSLLGSTNDGRQMSDAWLLGTSQGNNRILDAAGRNDVEAAKVRASLNSGRVEKWLVVTDRFGGVTVGLLDKSGRLIPQPVSKVAGGIR